MTDDLRQDQWQALVARIEPKAVPCRAWRPAGGVSAEVTAVEYAHLPYWDLCAALRPCSKLATWGLDEETERRMREQHRWFVDRALDTLSTRCVTGRGAWNRSDPEVDS